MGELVLLAVSVVLILLCGLFVAAEFSFITVDRTKVRRAAQKGDRKAIGLQHALKRLSTQLSGAQVGITITNLAIGYLAQPSLARMLGAPLHALGISGAGATGVSVIVALILATAATMIFGELVPKNLAIAMPMQTARSVQGFQRGFSWIMAYPIRVSNGTANYILRRMRIEPQEELASARSAEELTSLVRRSADKGVLPYDMALMIERSLMFGERRADEVMTPRARVESVSQTATAADVIAEARRTGFSRFPITGEDIDEIVGIVHIKSAISVPRSKRNSTLATDIAKKPVFAPSNIHLDPLLEILRGGGLQIAVLVDEFGGTDGIVTIEDLIEELVGEVQDEHDKNDVLMQKRKDGSWLISGLLRPDEAGQFLGITLPEEEEFETLGGLIAERLEKMPKLGDHVSIVGLDRTGKALTVVLRVARMDGLRVDTIEVRIQHVPKEPEGEVGRG